MPVRPGADVGEAGSGLPDYELGARERRVALGPEPGPDAVQLQILIAQVVAGRLQLGGAAGLAAVEGEAGLHGEEEVLLAVVQRHELAERLLEIHLAR